MRTIIKKPIWNILSLFYKNKNTPLHLREISRKIQLREGPLSRHLNALLKTNTLIFQIDANLKKFSVSKKAIPQIFPLFDYDRLESLPLLRKNAIKMYIRELENKPLFVIVFGSTAKGSYKDDSDIDVLQVGKKSPEDKVRKLVEAQTSLHIQLFTISEKQFIKELAEKKDNVIQSAMNTGFPVFNEKYFYEVVYHE